MRYASDMEPDRHRGHRLLLLTFVLTCSVSAIFAQRTVHEIVSSCEHTECKDPPFCFGFSCENADAGDPCFMRPSLENCPKTAFISIQAQPEHDDQFRITLVAAKGDWVGLIVADDSNDVLKTAKIAIICMLNPPNASEPEELIFYIVPPLNDTSPHEKLEKSPMLGTGFVTQENNNGSDSDALICEFTVDMSDAPESIRDLPINPHKIGFFGGTTGTGNGTPSYITSSNHTLNYFTRLGVSGARSRFGLAGDNNNFMTLTSSLILWITFQISHTFILNQCN